MKKILMFVNVDWFFLSHREIIAKEAMNRKYSMRVFTGFTMEHDIYPSKDGYGLHKSPISRASKGLSNFFSEILRTHILIKREKPDLIHAVTIKPILILGLLCRFNNIPFVGAISGLGPVFSQSSLISKIRFKIVTLLYKFIFGAGSSVAICQSDHDREVLLSSKIIEESKIYLVNGSGVDLKKFSPIYSIKEEKYVLMASRILREKGVKEFCEASGLLKINHNFNLKFKLAGPLDMESPSSLSREELDELCNHYHVDYLGDRADLNEILPLSKIFVLPSYYPEGIPKVLLEAAACGVPIITSDHPGCRDAIIPNRTGLLVKPKDSYQLAETIFHLINDRKRLEEFGREGRKMAEERFDANKVVSDHYRIYQETLCRKEVY